MADDAVGTNQAVTPESAAPSSPGGGNPEAASSPSPSPASSASPSFSEALRAETAPETAAPQDFDSRLASERATWQKQYEWVGDLTPETLNELRQAHSSVLAARQNPFDAATELLAAAVQNPALRPMAGRFVSNLLRNYQSLGQPQPPTATAPAQTTPDHEPTADVVGRGPDGNQVELYSGPQLVKVVQYHLNKLKAELTGTLQPLQEMHRTQQEQAAQAQELQGQYAHVQETYDRISKLPGFEENRKAITDAWEKMDNANKTPQQLRDNLHEAYSRVVFGKYQELSASAATADASRRAAASTGRPVTSQPTQSSATAQGFAGALSDAMARARKTG